MTPPRKLAMVQQHTITNHINTKVAWLSQTPWPLRTESVHHSRPHPQQLRSPWWFPFLIRTAQLKREQQVFLQKPSSIWLPQPPSAKMSWGRACGEDPHPTERTKSHTRLHPHTLHRTQKDLEINQHLLHKQQKHTYEPKPRIDISVWKSWSQMSD